MKIPAGKSRKKCENDENGKKNFFPRSGKGRKNYSDEAKKSQKTDDPDEKKQQIFFHPDRKMQKRMRGRTEKSTGASEKI